MHTLARLFSVKADLAPDAIEARLRRKPTPGEVIAVLIALTFLIAVSLLLPYEPDPQDGSGIGVDWRIFQDAATAETPYFDFYYYNPYWLLPLIYVIQLVGDHFGYFIWNLLNFAGVLFAARVFGGKLPPLVLSFQMVWVILAGQITGVMVAGAALMWWAMHRGWWHVAGLGALFAIGKYHWGVPLTLAIWLLNDARWQDRARVLIVPTMVALLSLVVYPLWVLDVLANVQNAPPEASASISLWQWVPVLPLLLWVPVLLLPMSRSRRLMLVATTAAIAMPYFQQADLILLFAMPTAFMAVLGQASWFLLMIDTDFSSLRWLFVVPLLIYVQLVWPVISEWRRQ
jgi:hypothetical protein